MSTSVVTYGGTVQSCTLPEHISGSLLETWKREQKLII